MLRYLKLVLFLIIGMISMLIPIVIQMKKNALPIRKSIVVSFVLTISGTLGTFILFYVESGRVGGISFFGALFIVPILFLPLSKLFRIKYGTLMDMCAPAECVMLIVMKLQCLIGGCCGGFIMYYTETQQEIRFPSQIVELINAVVLTIVLLLLSRNEKRKGTIYPWYMVLYGATRFVLNFFRDTGTVFLFMGWGSIWGLCSLIIGVLLLVLNRKKLQNSLGV